MANTILTPTQVTRKALMILHQKLNFVGNVTRDYDDSFGNKGAQIGDTLKVRLPNEFTVGTGAAITPQDTSESSVSLQVSTQKHVPLQFTDAELALSIDEFGDRFLEPAMSVLAAAIEADALSMYKDVYQQVNNHGSAGTYKKALEARQKLVEALAPVNDRHVVLNTQDNTDLNDALKGLFNPQDGLSKNFREGTLGRTAGFDWHENTLIPSHTVGAGSGYLVNGTIADGATTLAVNTGTGAIKKGDVFTIAGVYRVHPETKTSTGKLQQFVCAADYAGGAGNISISPAIVASGARQNVSNVPANGAAVSIAGTASIAHGVSLAFQKGAFAFATADLYLPKGTDFAAREVFDGISMRILKDFDTTNGRLITRADVLYGFKTLRPQLACRIANN